jgi:ketosteroid isomerase-like protein
VGESHEDIARRGYEAALRGDLESLREFLDPDVKWHGGDPDAPESCRNRDEALSFMVRAVESRNIGELVDVRGAGDRVVVIMRPRTRPGEESPLTANVTTFRDGRAVEMVHHANVSDALAAVSLAE